MGNFDDFFEAKQDKKREENKLADFLDEGQEYPPIVHRDFNPVRETFGEWTAKMAKDAMRKVGDNIYRDQKSLKHAVWTRAIKVKGELGLDNRVYPDGLDAQLLGKIASEVDYKNGHDATATVNDRETIKESLKLAGTSADKMDNGRESYRVRLMVEDMRDIENNNGRY